nr:L-aminoadipate-semialdehyde dehydrogenase-phosphopantetheinyl transferase isoform X4 [Oryctolagus cuniculus]
MVFPAKRLCLVPSMEGVRWAFSCGTWLPSRAEWLLAVRSIQPEEKERIGQFVFARDAKAAMAGRLMIRKLVAEKLNIPWNNIRLQRTAKGKPVLAKDSLNPYPNFNFNISHQGDFAVLAAEPELQVGVDIMKTSFPGRGSIPEFFHIMKRKFTNKEWETIRSFKDEWTQLDMFYRNWALKESYIKAIGVGLGFELQRLEFEISPLNLDIGQVYKETRLFLDGEEEKEWAFEMFSVCTKLTTPVKDSELLWHKRQADRTRQLDAVLDCLLLITWLLRGSICVYACVWREKIYKM